MEKTRKKFKETKVGVFLKDKAPGILNAVGEFLPDQGGLGIVKNIISSDSNIEPRDKATALQLLEQDIAEMNNISARWQSDMKSDTWVSKNKRRIAVILLTVAMTRVRIMD